MESGFPEARDSRPLGNAGSYDFLLEFLRTENSQLLIHFAGTNIGAPLSLTKNTTNFAGLVWLAFRPTT
jgi:hypothetical protein